MTEPGSIRSKEVEYRPIDQSYQGEIERMRHFELNYLDNCKDLKVHDYRLHTGSFYFKLCPSVDFDPLATDLIKGMYLPLDYWEILLNSSNVQGPNGGIRITYENVGRYINNTLFIQLVQAGWIGSRLSRTEALFQIIKQSLENDKSVMVAFSRAKNAESQRLFG